MVEVEGSQEFEAWFLTLAEKDAEAVARVVGLLEEKGVSLGFPYTSDIKDPLRVFYAFDPLRRAVLLLGGDKTGDDRFYETFVPHAERIWTEYLDDLEEKEKGR